jgi:hypothetical protein
VDSTSGKSSSDEDSQQSSADEHKPRSQQRDLNASTAKKTKSTKNRSLTEIKASYQNSNSLQTLPRNATGVETRRSPQHSSQSGGSQDFIPLPQIGTGWDEIVSSFQSIFQNYREAVMEKDNSNELASAEISLKEIGATILETCLSDNSDDSVKAKCQQFLQYVSGYCQSQNQMEMHAFFGDLLTQKDQGIVLRILRFITFVFRFCVQKTKLKQSIRSRLTRG